jgi:HD superfamily phosphohydrolase YqeK
MTELKARHKRASTLRLNTMLLSIGEVTHLLGVAEAARELASHSIAADEREGVESCGELRTLVAALECKL